MKTLAALLLTGESSLQKNRNLTPESARRLEEFAWSIEKWSSTPIHFTTWVWLNDSWFPLRIPAIAIPTMRVIERLAELGILGCTYRIYQARDYIIESQWLHRWRALATSEHMQDYLSNYLKRRFGELTQSIEYDFHLPIDPDERWKIEQFLRANDLPEMRKIVEYARSKSRNEESAYHYASANILCNLYAWEAHHILMWWEKERPFFKLWQAYEELVRPDMKSIPIIQSTGHIPVYYPQRDETYIDSDKHIIEPPIQTQNEHIRYDLSTL